MEAALSTGNNVEQTLTELELCFDVVVGAIRSTLPDEQVAQEDAVGAGDPVSVVHPLTRLKTLLKNAIYQKIIMITFYH